MIRVLKSARKAKINFMSQFSFFTKELQRFFIVWSNRIENNCVCVCERCKIPSVKTNNKNEEFYTTTTTTKMQIPVIKISKRDFSSFLPLKAKQ